MRDTLIDLAIHVGTGLCVAACGGGFATLVFM